MRYLNTLLILLFTPIVMANTHHITPLMNYSLDQDSGAGYGIAYGYQIIEGIDLEALYVHSNTISYQTSDTEYKGDFDNLFIGVNTIKRYNNDLSFKLGGGIGYTFNSNNENLVSDKKLNPYLKFTFNYRTSDNTSFEFGQLAQKMDGELSVNHSVFAGFSWKFGSKRTATHYSTPSKTSTTTTTAPKTVTPTQPTSPSLSLQPKATSLVISEPAQNDSPLWFVQLGAYKNLSHAESALATYILQMPEMHLHIQTSPTFYRLLSEGFADKAEANKLKQAFKQNYDVSSYITFDPK